MRQGVLGLAALVGLAVPCFAATPEAELVAGFVGDRLAVLEQEAADLEAAWPVPEGERAAWELRLRALRRGLELVDLERARAGLLASRALEPLQHQAARLQGALTIGTAPAEVQAPSCGSEPHRVAANGRIAGTVRRADNNAVVESAGIVIWNCLGQVSDVTETDAAGEFITSASLPPGRYYVSVDGRDGLVGEFFPDVTCFGCSAREAGAPVQVNDGGTTTGVDFWLAAGSVLQGSVRETGGAAISTLVYAATREGRVGLLVSTNGAGVFSSPMGVPAGDYVVFTYTLGTGNYVDQCYPSLPCLRANWSGDAGLPYVTASGTAPVTGLDFVLAPGARVNGTVTSTTATPLAGVSVTVATETGDTRCTATTDAAGAYECRGLLGGSYLMRAAKAGYVTELFFDIACIGCAPRGGSHISVSSGGLQTANFSLAAEASISGTLREGSGPGTPAVPNAVVAAYSYKGVLLATASSDASGNYTIGRLTAGNYHLRAIASGFLPSLYSVGPCPGCAVTASTLTVAIPSPGSVVTGRDIVMARDAALSGTITDAATGQAIASVGVIAYDVTGRPQGSAFSDCNGRYAFSGLEPGAYYLQTTNSLGYVDEAVGGVACWTCPPATGGLVTLSAAPTVMDFALDAGGKVVGRVIDAATGRGLADQYVVAVDAASGFGPGTLTDDLGRYVIRVQPGSYRVLVDARDGYRRYLHGVGSCDLSCPLSSGGTLVTVGTSPVTVDVSLQRGGRIVGRTLSATTSAPAASGVQVYTSAGGSATGVITHASGAFATMLGLPPGDYRLLAAGSRGYLPYRHGGGDCFPLSSCTPGTTNVPVSGTATNDVGNLLLTQGARMAGRIATVLSPAGGVGAALYTAAGAFVASTGAEAGGLFQFPVGLPLGTYHLRSVGNALGYVDRVYATTSCTALECVPTDGTTLTFLSPASAFVDLNLIRYKAPKGDLDRNLSTDLVLRNGTTNEHVAWQMSGTTLTSAVAFSPSTPSSPSLGVVGVDDFDSDGWNDLVLWNSATGAVEFWLMNGVVRSSLAPIGTPTPAPPWRLSATADFSRDGTPDLVWRNFATQKIEIWRMNGLARSSTLIPQPDQAVDANWEIVATPDLNGDGYMDFIWYNPSSGKIVAWFMDAGVRRLTGMFTTPANAGDSNWRVVAGGDYGIGTGGRPGTVDLVWRNATSGNLVVWHMNQRGERTHGLFTTPTSPTPALSWNVVGPR